MAIEISPSAPMGRGKASSSEHLWAKHGLTGLVLFALFGLVFFFINTTQNKDKQFLQAIESKAQLHSVFVGKLIDDSRDERKETRTEQSAISRELSTAINELTTEIKQARE